MKKILLLVVVAAALTLVFWPNSVTEPEMEIQDGLPVAIRVGLETLPTSSRIYTATVTKGSNVLDLMENLRDTQGFEFTTQEFEGLGMFVDTVDGVQPSDNKYWVYYVNEESATVGVEDYILEEDDMVRWALEESDL